MSHTLFDDASDDRPVFELRRVRKHGIGLEASLPRFELEDSLDARCSDLTMTIDVGQGYHVFSQHPISREQNIQQAYFGVGVAYFSLAYTVAYFIQPVESDYNLLAYPLTVISTLLGTACFGAFFHARRKNSPPLLTAVTALNNNVRL